MKNPFLIFVLIFFLQAAKGFGQATLIQTSHNPSNNSALAPELGLATADSGAFIIGTMAPGNWSSNPNQRTISKIDKFGNPQWQKYLQFQSTSYAGTTTITAACKTKKEGLLLCGLMSNPSDGLSPAFAICLDATGNTIWYKSIQMFNQHHPRIKAAIMCRDSGFVIAGSLGWNLVLIKLDKYGNTEWSNIETEVTEINSSLNCVLEAPDSSIYSGGKYMVDDYSQTNYPLLLKVNKNGSLAWKKTFPPTTTPFSKTASFTSLLYRDEIIYAAMDDGAAYLSALRTDGSVIWTKKINTAYYWNFNDCKSSHLSQTDAKNMFVTYGNYGFSSDTTGQVTYFQQSPGRISSFTPLLNKRFLKVQVADFWTFDVPLNSTSYTLTLNNALAPDTNRCFRLKPYTVSSFAMRDSLVPADLQNMFSSVNRQLPGNGTFNIAVRPGCDLLAGLTDVSSTALSFSVFPNPSTGKFILTSEGSSILSVCILSTDGSLVYSQDVAGLESMLSIDMAPSHSGIYFCKVRFSNGLSKTIKLVVEK